MGGNDQTTTSEPPAWSRPVWERTAKVGSQIYNQNAGQDGGLFDVWRGNTVADPSKATMSGIEGLINTSNNGEGLASNPVQLANDVFQNRGLTGAGQHAVDQLYAMGGRGDNSRQSTAEKYLTGMAHGDMLTGNPYFEAALQGQTDRTADQIDRRFAGGGRYGSGAHTGVLANELGNIRTQALADNYGRERGYQMQAIQGLIGDDQQTYANRLNALQSGLGAEQQGLGQAQSMAGLLPTIQQNRVFDENLKLQAGGLLDQQRQADLNNKIRVSDADRTRQARELSFLQSVASGSSGAYGTTTTSQPSNPFGMLGGLLGLFL